MAMLFVDVVGRHHPPSAATGTTQANQVARWGPKKQPQHHECRKVHAVPGRGQMPSKEVDKQGSEGGKDDTEPNSAPERSSNLCQRFDCQSWQRGSNDLGARRFGSTPWARRFPMPLQLIDGVARRETACGTRIGCFGVAFATGGTCPVVLKHLLVHIKTPASPQTPAPSAGPASPAAPPGATRPRPQTR